MPGRSEYRTLGAIVFDELCRRSQLTAAELVRRLCKELERSTLSRQTLASWRTGDQDVPVGALFAMAAIAGASPSEVAIQHALSVAASTDPRDTAMKALVARIYGAHPTPASSREPETSAPHQG